MHTIFSSELLMSIGGVATPMCHGGGIMHKTIADRILKIGRLIARRGEGGVKGGPPLPILLTTNLCVF